MQFSIRSLLILMSVVGVLCATMFVSSFLSRFILSTLFIVMATSCVTTAIFGNGWTRDFGLGASIGLVVLALNDSQYGMSSGFQSFLGFIYYVFLLALSGGTTVIVKNYVLRQQDPNPTRSPNRNSIVTPPPPPKNEDNEWFFSQCIHSFGSLKHQRNALYFVECKLHRLSFWTGAVHEYPLFAFNMH